MGISSFLWTLQFNFIFRSMIDTELFFSMWDKIWIKFISLYNNIQLFHIICWKKCPLFTEMLLQFGQNLNVYEGLHCGLCFVQLYFFVLLPTTHCIYYCSFIISHEIRSCWTFELVLYQICFGYSTFLIFMYS